MFTRLNINLTMLLNYADNHPVTGPPIQLALQSMVELEVDL